MEIGAPGSISPGLQGSTGLPVRAPGARPCRLLAQTRCPRPGEARPVPEFSQTLGRLWRLSWKQWTFHLRPCGKPSSPACGRSSCHSIEAGSPARSVWPASSTRRTHGVSMPSSICWHGNFPWRKKPCATIANWLAENSNGRDAGRNLDMSPMGATHSRIWRAGCESSCPWRPGFNRSRSNPMARTRPHHVRTGLPKATQPGLPVICDAWETPRNGTSRGPIATATWDGCASVTNRRKMNHRPWNPAHRYG